MGTSTFECVCMCVCVCVWESVCKCECVSVRLCAEVAVLPAPARSVHKIFIALIRHIPLEPGSQRARGKHWEGLHLSHTSKTGTHTHTHTHSIWFECAQTQEQNVQCDVVSVYLVKTFYPQFLSAELEASSEPITLSPFLAHQQMHTLNALSEPIICSICLVEGLPASIRCSRWPVGVGSWESVPRPKKRHGAVNGTKKNVLCTHTHPTHEAVE